MDPSEHPGRPGGRSLEALMDAFVDGDPRAFDALFRALSPRVVAFARYLSGDPGLAEDIAQTTFLKVHRARETYQRGSPLEPWVFAIARRSFLDHRRRTKRRPESPTLDGTVPEPPQEAPSVEGFDRLSDTQRTALLGCLDRLPLNQREALVLTKVDGLSTAAAAAVAGTTQGAIKLRAHRAYENLRRALGLTAKP